MRQNVDALGYIISQLAIYNTGKVLFAGVGDPKLPGAIQIWKMPLEKASEIQAHSKPIEKLRMNSTNTHLFSVGQDGMLCIFDIKDRDPQKTGMGFNMLQFSQEILTEKTDMDAYLNEQEQLSQEYSSLKDSNDNGVEKQLSVKKQLDKIHHLEEDMKSNKLQADNKQESLKRQIEEAINSRENERRRLLDRQQEVIEEKRNEYSAKMLEDAARFQQLQAQKEQERKNFEGALQKIMQEHEADMSFEQEQHRKEMEYKQTQIDEQQKDIDKTVHRNEMSIKQIEQDREDELNAIKGKNLENVTQVKDMALKSKAEYQLMQNRLSDIKVENEKEDTKCREFANLIEKQETIMLSHRTDIDELTKQIQKKDKFIGDRESKIYQLKKKTQELEKFKFVLDYKIKELKRDITPKEVETSSLKL